MHLIAVSEQNQIINVLKLAHVPICYFDTNVSSNLVQQHSTQ